MEYHELRERARARLAPDAWAYYSGSADGESDADKDSERWRSIALRPRAMRGLDRVSTHIELDTAVHAGGAKLSTPVMVAASAAHSLAHPDGELGTVRGAASANALMVYSSSAGVEVGTFGAHASTPWWAQVYVMKDRGITDDYVARAVSAGAGALVLTVDYPGAVGSGSFRTRTRTTVRVTLANYAGVGWSDLGSCVDPEITPDEVGRLADRFGLPVHVKGILRADDALDAVSAGAAGIIVSNHGRRQVPGVLSVADALPDVVAHVGDRVPIAVDGGVRTGADVFRALAMGAYAVGIGRSVLWALAVDGEQGVASQIRGLTDELSSIMASSGLRSLAEIDATYVRRF